MNLFGKPKPKPNAKDSIGKLRETLDLLEKREKYLQKKIDSEQAVARQNANKNKRMALLALKRKHTYEKQAENIAGARLTIETQVMALESAQVDVEALQAMQMGAKAMKNIHSGMTVDDVDNTMDEIREQMDVANEISEAIAHPVGFGAEFDDDELEAELAALQETDMADKLTEIPAGQPVVATTISATAAPSIPAGAAPAVPTATPALSQEERELRELEAEMDM